MYSNLQQCVHLEELLVALWCQHSTDIDCSWEYWGLFISIVERMQYTIYFLKIRSQLGATWHVQIFLQNYSFWYIFWYSWYNILVICWIKDANMISWKTLDVPPTVFSYCQKIAILAANILQQTYYWTSSTRNCEVEFHFCKEHEKRAAKILTSMLEMAVCAMVAPYRSYALRIFLPVMGHLRPYGYVNACDPWLWTVPGHGFIVFF